MEIVSPTEVAHEDWRAIPGYEGLYEVSTEGRIKSLAGPKSPRIMLFNNCRGYRTVELWKDRTGKRFTVHRIVCLAFQGPRPDGFDINHKNGVKSDNRNQNLEYVTKSENRKHAFATGLQTNNGIKHSQHKLSEEDVRAIRNLICEMVPYKDIAPIYGVTASAIASIKLGRTWAHLK